MTIKFNFYLDRAIKLRLDSLASGYGVSVSYVINSILEKATASDLPPEITYQLRAEGEHISKRKKEKGKRFYVRADKVEEVEEFKKGYFEALK